MWWEIALVIVVVAACATALVVKFTRSMSGRKGACACSGCPAAKLADRLSASK